MEEFILVSWWMEEWWQWCLYHYLFLLLVIFGVKDNWVREEVECVKEMGWWEDEM